MSTESFRFCGGDMITAQDIQDLVFFFKAIGTVVFMLAYMAGTLACLFVFVVGTLTIAGWLIDKPWRKV